MFEESLLESTTAITPRNRWPVAASIGIQALCAVALLAVPLLHPEVMRLKGPHLSLIAPRFEQPVQPPPQPRVHIEANTNTAALSAPSGPSVAVLGRRIPNPMDPSGETAPDTGPINMAGNSSGPFAAVVGIGTGPSHPSVVRAGPPHPSALTRISQGVSAGLLIEPIRPIYPAIAKTAGVQGTVVVQAIISKTGHIESAHAVSGPALLQGAAVDAVRNARYRPFLLSGEPTEVDTTVSINFHLGSS